jgi:hypothetical protein
MSPLQANRPDWIAAGNGAAGGSANARGIARVYGALARGGELDGVRIISPEGVALASAQRREGKDKVLGVWVRWAAGFILSSKGLYGPMTPALVIPGGAVVLASPIQSTSWACLMR